MKPAIIAAACVLSSAIAASADQFVIQLDGPVAHASPGLLAALHVDELDAFELDGRDFLVLAAPNADYVEAYTYAMSVKPVKMFALEADWTGDGLSSLPIDARKLFMLSTPCGFCSS